MKQKSAYMLLLAGASITILIVLFAYKKQQSVNENVAYTLLKRDAAFSDTAEWNFMKERVDNYMTTLSLNQSDLKALTGIAGVYVQEGRITGNYGYYDKAALHYINKALKVDSNYFDALTISSLLWLNQHHFQQGLDVAKKLVRINPYNAFVYGLLTDGNVEMGYYDSALTSAQKMMDIRPDIRSYSRVSYLRELYGDIDGAIESMQMAIESGVPGDENTSWCRVQLGNLLSYVGDTAAANIQYNNALYQRPGYAFAEAGLAKIFYMQDNWKSAEIHYKKALTVLSDNAFKEALADVYRQIGKQQEADALMKEVIQNLSSTNIGDDVQTSGHGHYADKELAYAYLLMNEKSKAKEHAIKEYNRRPLNGDVCEMMAWISFKNNDIKTALKNLPIALKTGSKNPVLMAHAGIIYANAKEDVKAKEYLSIAMKHIQLLPYDLQVELKKLVSVLQ